MVRVQSDIDEDLNLRLKTYILHQSGKLKGGQSEFIAQAIEHELDRLEKEAGV